MKNEKLKVLVSKKFLLTHLKESDRIIEIFEGRLKYNEITSNTIKNKLIQNILSFLNNKEIEYNLLHETIISFYGIEDLNNIELIDGNHRVFNLLAIGADFIPFYIKPTQQNINIIKNNKNDFKIDDNTNHQFDLKNIFLNKNSNLFIGDKFINEIQMLEQEIKKYGYGKTIDTLNDVDIVKKILNGLSDDDINEMIDNMPSIENILIKYKNDFENYNSNEIKIILKYKNYNIDKKLLIKIFNIGDDEKIAKKFLKSKIHYFSNNNKSKSIITAIDTILNNEPNIKRLYLKELLKNKKHNNINDTVIQHIVDEEINFIKNNNNEFINNFEQLKNLNLDILINIDYKIIQYINHFTNKKLIENFILNNTDFSIKDLLQKENYKLFSKLFFIKLIKNNKNTKNIEK